MDIDESSERPELSIAEAVEQYKCSEGKLFYKAAIGALTIHVKTSNWNVLCIFSIKSLKPKVIRIGDTSRKSIVIGDQPVQALLPEFPEMKDIESVESKKDIEDIFARVFTSTNRFRESQINQINKLTEGFNEIVNTGLVTLYPNNGISRFAYMFPQRGIRPVSTFSFAMYRDGSDKGILLRLNPLDSINEFIFPENSTEEFCILTDSRITIQEALNDGKLYVMKSDVEKMLIEESSAPSVAKPKGSPAQETQDDEEITPASPMQTAAEKNQPAGLTIKSLAFAFNEIGWSENKWNKYLDTRLAWVIAARIIEGKQGGVAATFNPVPIATRLKSKKGINPWDLNNAFRDSPSLHPWADEWHDSHSPYKNHKK